MSNEISFKISSASDIEILMAIRLEMLRIVNGMSADEAFSDDFVESSEKYFLEGNQTTVLAFDGVSAIGCATLSYIDIMPTFSHPTGHRAHLMNVYTNASYRRQGISWEMVTMLMNEAKERGVTEISLDTTEMGRPLYESLGFTASDEAMVFTF